MPSIQDIEKFNASLVTIGDEPAVLKERGEELEDVDQPGEGMPPDLSELLDDGAAPGSADESEDDLGEEDFLQSFAAAMQETEDEGEAGADPFADLDLDLSLDDELAAPDEPADADEAAFEEPTGDEEPFEAPAADESADDESADNEWPAAEPEGEGLEEAGDFGSFDIPDFDAEETADADEELGADVGAPEDTEDLENFDLGEFTVDDDEFAGDELGSADAFEEQEGAEEEGAEEGGVGEALADLDEQEGFSFDLEEGGVPDAGDEYSFEDETFEGAGEETPSGEESFDEELGEGDFDDIDQFSLDDFGAEFGVTEEEELGDEEDFEIEEGDEEPVAAAPSELEISEEDFAAVQRALGGLPLNLKIAVEDIIAESRGTSDQLSKLLDLLAKGESARTIADYAGKILGKEIKIPRGYEKRTGIDFERERQTFAYRFRENVLPVLKVAALAGATLALLVFLGYQLIYRPIRARNLYVAGYEDIQREEYTEANRNFDSAYDTWVMERWFFRYADAFAEKRQYALAAEKYDQLIFGMSESAREVMIQMLNRRAYDDILDIREIHREGVLAYAEMESEVVANYDKADRLLSLLLSRNLYDYDALLAKGDNAMEWAQEDPSKYEDARVAYASLIQEYGETDTLLFRMLRYFIRTDNELEVMRLKELFQSDRSVDVNPEIYAELGGYLIDRSELDDVRDILFRAMDQREDLPEIHYHLARYFRRIGEPVEEEKGLRNTLTFLNEYEPLSRGRLAILADTHGRLGELNYDREQYLTAEQHFRDGVRVYENALDRGLIERSPQFGRLYAGLGDISYYVALEYDVADRLYRQAENHEFTSREMDFRQGYIHYLNGEYGEALSDFYDAAGGFSRNINLLYATANSLHNERSYFAAEAYYRELLDRLQRQRRQISNLLVDEDPEHRQLIDYLVRVNNNLGITLHRLSQMTGDEELGARGLYYLNSSSEYAENLGRDRRTMERSSSVDLAFLNTREILYPQPNYALQLYNEIPRDFEDVRF